MDDAEFLKKYGDLCTEAITRRIKLEPDIFFVELPGKGKNSVKVILVRKGYAGISVSKEALAFGIELSDFLVFPVKSPIGYELLHQLVVHDITDLSKFQFASECCGKYPDYFGQVPPAPAGTPFGVGYRYFSVAPGVYFIETLDGYYLAVSYEVWRYDLSDETVHESYSFNTDLQTGLLNARSYIFFRCEECELAVFELLETGKYPVLEKYLVSPLALYERLWATHPEFLENWNNQVMDKAKRVCGPFRDLANLASTLQLVPKWVDRQPQCVDFLSLPGYRDEGSISESDDDEEYILEHYDGRWGKIKTIEESSPGVFLVNHDDNDVAGRYILLQDFGESVLSHQAISYGDSMNGLIYFDIDSGSPVVLFELLRSTLPIVDEDEAFEISTDLYCTGSYLSEFYEDYFGEIPPPPRFVPGGEGSRYIKVHRGLYFVEGPNDWYLAAGVEAASNLTLEAKSLGQRIELSEQASNSIVPMEWIFFSLSICARPVCEFYCNDVFKKDMGRFITSWPDLLRVVKMGLDTSWKQKVNSHEFLKLPGLY